MAKPSTSSQASRAERPRVGKVVLRATTSPINLGIGAAAATLAIGLGSLPLAALGALAYAALVAYDTFNPAFWNKVYALPAPERLALPEPSSLSDPGMKRAVTELRASRHALDRVLADTPPEVLASLSTTLSSLQALENQAARLIRRGEDVMRHLATVDEPMLRADAAALVKRAQATADGNARQGFDDARRAREDELRTLGELRAAKDRIDANLLHVIAVLGGLPTKVVHMRALDNQAADKFSGDVNSELTAIADELETSEQVMKSLGEVHR